MGAAVLEGVDDAVLIAGDHDRHVAETGGAKGVGLGQLRLQAQERPGVAAEDALLLLGVKLAVGIEPVGDAGEAFGGPLPPRRVDVHDLLRRSPQSILFQRHARRLDDGRPARGRHS